MSLVFNRRIRTVLADTGHVIRRDPNKGTGEGSGPLSAATLEVEGGDPEHYERERSVSF